MADDKSRNLHRRVTPISGERLRPLQLLGEIAKDVAVKSNARLQQKRAMPISENKLSFDPSTGAGTADKKIKRTASSFPDRPKYPYSEFLRLDQAGPAVIAYCENTKACSLVAIKTSRVHSHSLDPLQTVRGDNIVSWVDIYWKEKEVTCMVYEQMDVSLRLVNSIARSRWNVYEIAAICKEVLDCIPNSDPDCTN